MSGIGKVHYIANPARGRASCDGNGRMHPGFAATREKSKITCARCLKMVAAGDVRRAAVAAEESRVNAEFAARCLVQR